MSEQAKLEEEIKPSNPKASSEYLKGYRAGYNRVLKTLKTRQKKLEVSVQKPEQGKVEKQPVVEKPHTNTDNNRVTVITAIVIAVVLIGVFWYVVRARNRSV
jgi:hypothetical protein